MIRTPLMPKATAVWLVDNTALTFEQIAEFCGLHVLCLLYTSPSPRDRS